MGVNPVKPQAAQSRPLRPGRARTGEAGTDAGAHTGVRGEGRVGTPELLDTHRPDAFRIHSWGRSTASPLGRAPAARLALRIFRPRRAARVAIASGQPSFVMADGVRGKVLDLAGPWRTSGDWWTPTPGSATSGTSRFPMARSTASTANPPAGSWKAVMTKSILQLLCAYLCFALCVEENPQTSVPSWETSFNAETQRTQRKPQRKPIGQL